MQSAAQELELNAGGLAAHFQGTVRISASVAVTMHHVPMIVAQIRQREPLISITLLPSDEPSKLHFREADIALRMYRPTRGIMSNGEVSRGSRATSFPTTPSASTAIPASSMGFRRAGFPVDRDLFKVRCDDQAAYWALVKAGCGIGFAQTAIGRRDPELVEVRIDFGLPKLPLWLTAHDVIRQTPRVARVWEILAQELKAICD